MSLYTLPCAIDGCSRKVHGRSRYCATHHYREHSHGHPLQEPIYPYLKEPVERLTRWAKTPEGKRAVDAAVAHYEKLAEFRLKEWQSDYDEMVRSGIQHSSPHHEATEIIAHTYQSKDARKTVIELLALGVLLEESPQSFRSDQAFLCEATHVFLRGSVARTQYRYRSQAGRRKAVTRYLRKKTRLELGRWITRELVHYGVLIHRQWERRAAEEKRQRARVTEAILGQPQSTLAQP